ncbi:DNA-binding response regulator [Nocardiopsis terrae]|uniref:DNA-binding NarL/FixJ family response regulator n=1 Tax=Nocardiopsis terrae TaxID=372655 RepID=A0ABR9HDT1_9ACTN|nr:response regulator transcription factor [Nocardiopsis terrae]MBE1457191.1 DNA-binding NarL/FixJ family response regulator [Nocardiopsis terrae]GHC91069.1 DNA-binding response regulator [Nocardiopsis terrae]
MRIVIAEDDALLREGMAALLRDEGFEIVAAVGEADALVEAVAEHGPDLAVIDVRMPPTHTDEGIRAAARARRVRADLPVLVLSAYVERSFATELMRTGTSGIGYLLKERVGRVEQFLDTLRRVADGQTAIDPEVVAQLFARRSADDVLSRLSPRERDVLALMAEGLGNGAIAERMTVTDGAVHKHIRSIFGKLGLAPDDRSDRRVAAVLRYLDATAR